MSTILLADDDEDIRTVFRLPLERLHFRVLEAATGTIALDLTGQEHPDVLVLDWTMPGLTGIEILTALRQDPSTATIPVIMLSGKEEGSEQAQAVRLGAFAYLVKPVGPQQLLDTIQEALRQKG